MSKYHFGQNSGQPNRPQQDRSPQKGPQRQDPRQDPRNPNRQG